MSIIGDPLVIWPRSFCRMLIHLCPCFGIGLVYPGNSLSTYSSMVASVHRLQLVHSATSMIMFHFFIGGSLRYFAGTSVGGAFCLRAASCLISAFGSSLPVAKAAARCSVRPSQGSISTRALAPASACVDLVCERSGVSRLRQPPRSTDL